MPLRIPHHTVTVHRDGKNIRPRIGQPFEFTADEIAEIHAAHPRALRRPVNEVRPPVAEVTSEVEEEIEQPKPAGRKAPRKAAVATDDDDEL